MIDRRETPLGRKIMAAILGTTLIALILTFFLGIVPALWMYRVGTLDRTIAQSELLSAQLVAAVDFADPDAAEEGLATLSLVQSVRGAAIYMADDAPFASYGVTPPRIQAIRMGLNRAMVVTPIPSVQPGCTLVMEVSFAGQWELIQSQLLISLAILLLVVLVSYRLAGMFRRKLVEPLGTLTEAVRDISQSRAYSRRVDYDGDDEIGVLIDEFNSMVRRVEERDERLNNHRAALEEEVKVRTYELWQNQQELLRNNDALLSEIKKRAKAEMIREEVERINRHDLKSGLSLVIGYPELLLEEGELNSRQTKHLKRIRAAGYRMLDMIRNQLNIFKLEKGIYPLQVNQVDIVEVICSLEDEFGPLLESMGVGFRLQLDGREVVGDEVFTIAGEVGLIRTMFRNLILNAIEASSSGEDLSIVLFDGERKEVHISNTQPVHPDIRRRFFHKHVTYGKDNGTGLGTYFAALIAKSHGAHISMKTDDDTGTTVSVIFRMTPVVPASKSVRSDQVSQ